MASDQDMSSVNPSVSHASAELTAVLESAARLQELVPDAVLVGGSAAALYADSFNHDHVLADLRDRFDVASSQSTSSVRARARAAREFRERQAAVTRKALGGARLGRDRRPGRRG